MEDLVNYIKDFKELLSIPVLVYLAKSIIDNWNVDELEKILMTNFKRFQVDFSKYLLTGLLVALMIPIIISFNYGEYKEELNTMEDFFIDFIIITLLIIIVFFVLLNYLIVFLEKYLTPKYKYLVNEKYSKEQWEIIRLSKKDTLLVKNGVTTKFISNIYELEYQKSKEQTGAILNIYRNNTLSIIILIVLAIAIFTLIVMTRNVNELLTLLTYYIMIIILLITMVIFGVNYLFIKLDNFREKNIKQKDDNK